MFDRWLDRFRPSDDADSRDAVERTKQILDRVHRQEPEVRRHVAFARRTIRENELAPKIRAALRETY